MTKQEYEMFDNGQFLTDEETDHISELNEKNGYGLSYNMLKTLTRQHKTARKIGDYRTMVKIEYRLTQINFHWECGKMFSGHYEEIFAAIKVKFNK